MYLFGKLGAMLIEKVFWREFFWRNLVYGFSPNYKMKNIYKAINELKKEEEQQ